jgi:DDE superfamily endonuclease
MTGLSKAQLAELVARVYDRIGGYHSGGRGYCLGLYRSVALVVFLLRENPTQTVAAGVFGVSQSTVSRRWDALREVIATVLADMRPDPAEAARDCTVLVDGTLARTWDWTCRTDLYSGKHRDTGFNLQIATTLTGRLLAVGTPIPGARHDAHAWAASGLAETLDGLHVLADLGYLGTGALTGTRTPPGGELSADRAETNQALSGIRAVVEHAISHLKNWKILGGRCRAPIHKYESIVRAVTALHFYKFNWCL